MKKLYGLGIDIEIVGLAAAAGYNDINEYIRYLLAALDKKHTQYLALQRSMAGQDQPPLTAAELQAAKEIIAAKVPPKERRPAPKREKGRTQRKKQGASA